VAGSPRIEFVLEAIDAAVAIMRAQPPSPESDRLTREAASLQQAVHGWRRSPPSRALREDTMKRVLRLHVGVATLARLGTAPTDRAQAGLGPDVSDENDRITAPPPFDIEAFARETTAPHSERRPPFEPPTQPWQDASHLPAEPVTARRPSLSFEQQVVQAPPQRTFSPSSIERALLGAVDGPVVTQRDIQDPTAEMLECYSLGDYAGAIALADLVLTDAPESLVALECRSKSSAALEGIYAARLGPMSRMAMVLMPATQIDCVAIDHRAGFLLSLVDGSSTLEAILDVCGMPRLDALRILHELVQRGAVGLT
jgi:hypothetical protein